VADYARACIYVFRTGTDGAPDPSTAAVFAKSAGFPVDLQMGPDGSLYYADIVDGTVQRISFPAGNHSPTARATATPDHGPTPLSVSFSGTTSSDPDGDALTYSWDLNGDGTFGDSTSPAPTFTYSTPGVYTARLRVSDPGGNTDTASVTIQAGNPPTPTIDSPADTLTWAVGDTISYSGHATDGAGNPVPASGLTWQLNIRHCARTDVKHVSAANRIRFHLADRNGARRQRRGHAFAEKLNRRNQHEVGEHAARTHDGSDAWPDDVTDAEQRRRYFRRERAGFERRSENFTRNVFPCLKRGHPDLVNEPDTKPGEDRLRAGAGVIRFCGPRLVTRISRRARFRRSAGLQNLRASGAFRIFQ